MEVLAVYDVVDVGPCPLASSPAPGVYVRK